MQAATGPGSPLEYSLPRSLQGQRCMFGWWVLSGVARGSALRSRAAAATFHFYHSVIHNDS